MFWEELIAYFPLIQHEPDRKLVSNDSSVVVCVFVPVGTCPMSHGLAIKPFPSNNRGNTCTDRQQGDLISLPLFFPK
jgi:hypothetical protein